MYTLKQAADAVGRGKPALLKAIQKGRLSAGKNDNGHWVVDPAELYRVYKPTSKGTTQFISGTTSGERQELPKEPAGKRQSWELESLKITIKDRDREREDLKDTIDDLRRRLDNEAEERRKLTLMLVDQRKKKGLFARLFGK